MSTVQFQIKNENDDCYTWDDPASPPIVDLHKIGSGTTAFYEPRYSGYPVEEMVVVFLTDKQTGNNATVQFSLVLETENYEPDPLSIDQARFESTTVTDARCSWTIENGSATKKGRITMTVVNHEVDNGSVVWTFGELPGAPPAKLALTVKRQDAAISCP
jgi:hypothetical protein